MRKVSISIAILQLKYGDEEALRIAKRIGADAVDFNLCDNDRKNPNDIYSKDDDAILEYTKEFNGFIIILITTNIRQYFKNHLVCIYIHTLHYIF